MRGTVRRSPAGATLHTIARGLGVPTSYLLLADSPAPVVGDEATKRSLVPIRMALMPPVGIDGFIAERSEQPDHTDDLRQRVLDVHTLYRADRFESVAVQLPGLLRQAAVGASAASGKERRRATVTQALALLVTGKYLTQVRQGSCGCGLPHRPSATTVRTMHRYGSRAFRPRAPGIVG
ncbi:hypothetical protein ABT354_08370 [Streptomyces sp. NPDC000594]|uniref:hypothetical protein n=1 Tax=Streptomyces sp. NPDC000594 TaxID=3154261 RepID=UPI00332E0948